MAGAGADVGDHQTIGRAEPGEDRLNRLGGIRRPVIDVITRPIAEAFNRAQLALIGHCRPSLSGPRVHLVPPARPQGRSPIDTSRARAWRRNPPPRARGCRVRRPGATGRSRAPARPEWSCRQIEEGTGDLTQRGLAADAAPERIGKPADRQRPDIGELRLVERPGSGRRSSPPAARRGPYRTPRDSLTPESRRRSAVLISHSRRSTRRIDRAFLLKRRFSSARRIPHTAWKYGISAARGTSLCRARAWRSRPCRAGRFRPSAPTSATPRHPSDVARHDGVATAADRHVERRPRPA